ncbi:MAG TPA: outer membrane beta-barrel protein [Stellaceae bacterium]|nr:outer membrane beta-barrel protein [Stellaceae bacterium]
MRLRISLLVALWAVMLVTMPARANPAGWYVGGAGGWSTIGNVDSGGSLNFSSTENNGFTALGFAGYDFGRLFSAEAELGYHHHDVKSLTVNNDGGLGTRLGVGSLTGVSASPTGSINALSFMLNGIMTLLPSWRVSPYIGAGIGGARLTLDKLGVAGVTLADDTTTEPAAQAIAGIETRLAPRVSLALDYRYFATLDPTFKDSSGTNFRTRYHEQNLLLKVVYRFGASSPPPPVRPAAGPPPPLPPPAPAVQPVAPPVAAAPPLFLVFFDFDKATLTPAGAEVVRQAAAAYKSAGAARIDVTGYTDLAGPARYNLELSKRRAATVSGYLMRLGVPRSAVVERGRGEENPRVPTASGVREPENRRVEIVFP